MMYEGIQDYREIQMEVEDLQLFFSPDEHLVFSVRKGYVYTHCESTVIIKDTEQFVNVNCMLRMSEDMYLDVIAKFLAAKEYEDPLLDRYVDALCVEDYIDLNLEMKINGMEIDMQDETFKDKDMTYHVFSVVRFADNFDMTDDEIENDEEENEDDDDGGCIV